MEWKRLYHKYQNRDRYRQIIHTVSRHGFSFLLQKKGFRSIGYWRQRILPHYPKPTAAMDAASELTLPQRVRLLFEDLGPTFVKMGQVLSTRPDLVPREYAGELGRLQDRVGEERPEEVRKQFINSWGVPPEEMFSHFDYQPVAAASIAQVHKAVMPDGGLVAVKVQRSDVKQIMEKDLCLLRDMEKLLQRSMVGDVCDVAAINALFSRQIHREMDFTVEGLNMERFAEAFADSGIIVPKVYWQLTSQRILTMDWVEGNSANQVVDKYRSTPQGEKFAELVLHTVLLPFFRQGIFHGDPHPGNVFWVDEGLALVDFGITGRLDQAFRFTIAELMIAISQRDTCAVVEITKRIGVVTKPVNEEHLFQDVSEMLDRAVGLGNGGLSFSNLVNGMIDIALQHGIKMPGSFFLLGKAMLTAEGLARQFNPNIDVVAVSQPLAVEYIKTHFRPQLSEERVYKQGANILKGMLEFPKDVAQVISELAKGELSIVFIHRGLEILYDKLDVVSTRLAISLIIVAMMVSSALIMHAGTGPLWRFGYPLLGMIGFSTALMLGAWMIVGLLRDGKIR